MSRDVARVPWETCLSLTFAPKRRLRSQKPVASSGLTLVTTIRYDVFAYDISPLRVLRVSFPLVNKISQGLNVIPSPRERFVDHQALPVRQILRTTSNHDTHILAFRLSRL